MGLRIACDLDGTVADMDAALQREAERLYGEDVDVRARGPVVAERARGGGRLRPAADAPVASGLPVDERADPIVPVRRRPLTDAQLRHLWAHVRSCENFWTTLSEVEPGSVARLAELAATHRWEVLFLTQRPETAGLTAQRQSQHWLAGHGFEQPSVFVMQGSRGKLAEALALHVVVDDRLENCSDVRADSQARAVLVWRSDPGSVPGAVSRLGIDVVHSMNEALEELVTMGRGATGPRGVWARLRAVMRT